MKGRAGCDTEIKCLCEGPPALGFLVFTSVWSVWGAHTRVYMHYMDLGGAVHRCFIKAEGCLAGEFECPACR